MSGYRALTVLTTILTGTPGGNDLLTGEGGDDVYYLGEGTDDDGIWESYGNTGSGDDGDVVMVKSGITRDRVRLRRGTNSLYVELWDAEGSEKTDSLKVTNYYVSAVNRVEKVLFEDDDEDDSVEDDQNDWGAYGFSRLRLHGTSAGGERIEGQDGFNDWIDGDAGGDDILSGKGGE